MKNIEYRNFTIDTKALDIDSREIKLSFSSEEPYKRERGTEILSHQPDHVDLTRINQGGSFLLDHDMKKVAGGVVRAWIENKRGHAVVKLSRNKLGQELLDDIQDGIRTNISVGYTVKNMVENEDHYLVDDWQVYELSSVGIAADNSVGIGRSAEKINNKVNITMNENIESRADVIELMALGRQYNKLDEAMEHAQSGGTVEQFRSYILENLGPVNHIDEKASFNNDLGLSKKEIGSYNIANAIMASAENDWSKAGFEREVSLAAQKQSGKNARGGFIIPDEVFTRTNMTVGSAASMGNVVQTDKIGIVDVLLGRTLIERMGCTKLSGLQGSISLPRATSGNAASWLAEDGNATESLIVTENISASPKTVSANSTLSRRLLLQSSINVQNYVQQDILRHINVAIDSVAIEGAGSNEPTGIIETSGIGDVAVSGSVPSHSDICDLWSTVSAEDADVGSLAFLTTPEMASILAQVPEVNATTGDRPVWSTNFAGSEPGRGSMLGFPAYYSSLVPSDLQTEDYHVIIFGNMQDLVLCEWGGLTVITDPYSESNTGAVRINVFKDVDIIIRHTESFAAILDASLS